MSEACLTDVFGWLCIAFRGFGAPQVTFACETVIEHVAAYLREDPSIIRHRNLLQEGDRNHHDQVMEHWHVPRIVDELTVSSDFQKRREQVNEFNKTHPFQKRGICLLPAKFGIGYVIRFLNQAGALVHIYRDGSVILTHGGVEMGQGLHIKMIGIAAEALGCDADRIRISETATDKVHNATPSGGSVTADLNGMAVKDACEQLRQRLDALVADKTEKLSWNQLIKLAYHERVDLCARGFHSTPDMFDVDFDKCCAKFNYFSQGAAVSEVELDVLTGNWQLRRVDILMVSISSMSSLWLNICVILV
jgi:xanthine dehydrogenase/oxidase